MMVQPAFNGGLLSWQLGVSEKKILTFTQVIEQFYLEFEPDDELTFKPLANVLNPEQLGIPVYPGEMVRLLLYRRAYRILVKKHNKLITGPHAARLCYRSNFTGTVHWLATLQIMANFFSEEAVLKEINKGIAEKRFYISPKSSTDTLVQ